MERGLGEYLPTPFSTLSWQAGPQLLMSEPPVYCNLVDLRRCLQSPPPSPACPPLQRLDAWEQHLDPDSGLCFYRNALTGCKSWKPPRRTRTPETVSLSLSPHPPPSAPLPCCLPKQRVCFLGLPEDQKNQKSVRRVLRAG